MRNFNKGIFACMGVVLAAMAWVGCSRADSALTQYNLNNADIEFVKAASMANYTELVLARLDTSMSTDSAMKDFGDMMIADHTPAGTQLKQLATEFGMTAVDTLDDAHVALRANLMTLSGRSFDSTYIKNMVLDHQAAVTLFQTESTNGQQQSIRAFAQSLLPTLQMHLDKATALASTY